MTPRKSVRAQAQEIYREMVAQLPSASPQTRLIPAQTGIQDDPALPGDGCPGSPLEPVLGPTEGRTRVRGRAEGDLTTWVRGLYEHSTLPVAEIARRAGVSERTIYKRARKGRWKPRYAWMPDGSRPPGRPGRARFTVARQRKRAQAFAPVKGAGGRFVRRADKGKPFAQGLKATDPAAGARGIAACAQAERIEREARELATLQQQQDERLRAIAAVNRALGNLVRYREERAKAAEKRRRESSRWQPYGAPMPPAAPEAPDELECAYGAALSAAIDWLESLRREHGIGDAGGGSGRTPAPPPQ